MTTGPLFCDPLDALAHCDLVNTLALGPAAGLDTSLAQATSTNARSNNDIPLLGLVAQGASPVDPGRSIDASEHILTTPLDQSLSLQILDEG